MANIRDCIIKMDDNSDRLKLINLLSSLHEPLDKHSHFFQGSFDYGRVHVRYIQNDNSWGTTRKEHTHTLEEFVGEFGLSIINSVIEIW